MESARLPLTCLLCNEDVGLQSRSHQSRLRTGSQQPPESLLVTDGLSEGQILTPSGKRAKVFWWQLSVRRSALYSDCDGYSIFMWTPICFPVLPRGSVTLLPPFQYFLSTCWLSCLEFKTGSYISTSSPFAYPYLLFKIQPLFHKTLCRQGRCCSLQLGIVFCSPPGPGTEGPQGDSHPRAFFFQALASFIWLHPPRDLPSRH